MTDTSLAYFEWSAPEGSDLDDIDALRQANPAFGIRINDEFSRLERAAMTDDEYARERLGIFPDEDDAPQWLTVTEPAWRRVAHPAPESDAPWLVGPVTLAVEMANDRSRTTIAVAGHTAAGKPAATIAAIADGPPEWVVDEVLTLKADTDRPVTRMVIDPRSPAGSLIDDFTAAGIEVTECPTADLVRATGALLDDIATDSIEIRTTPELDAAVSVARLRKVGEAHVIDRWSPDDASPFIAVDLARWGLLQPVEDESSVYEDRGLVSL